MPRKIFTAPVKPRFVKVYRYFRYEDEYGGVISSHGGITALCVLDYEKMVINVYPSVCSREDNFSKQIGRDLAKEKRMNDIRLTVPLIPGKSIQYCIEEQYYNHNLTKCWSENTSEHFKELFYDAWGETPYGYK